jgi:hypothetical protein
MTTKEVNLYKNVPTFRIIWRGARILEEGIVIDMFGEEVCRTNFISLLHNVLYTSSYAAAKKKKTVQLYAFKA